MPGATQHRDVLASTASTCRPVPGSSPTCLLVAKVKLLFDSRPAKTGLLFLRPPSVSAAPLSAGHLAACWVNVHSLQSDGEHNAIGYEPPARNCRVPATGHVRTVDGRVSSWVSWDSWVVSWACQACLRCSCACWRRASYTVPWKPVRCHPKLCPLGLPHWCRCCCVVPL